MSTAKHTPGPWEVRADAHGRGRIYARGTWIATTWLATDDGNDAPRLPALSNARLIAAAPELLAELINCRNDLARLAAELRSSVTVPGTEEILDDEDRSLCEFEESRVARLDALIAKAMGAKP